MSPPPDELTIGALAKSAGVNVETIRFYQRKGLLPEPVRPYGGIRRYGATDLARLRFVKSAQRLGFSLEEIAQLLLLEDGTHCREAAQLATAHLSDVRARLADLHRIEAALSQLLAACESRRGQVSCPLIDALH
ncbi:Hg(II)-responsive transcriptional regulator [Pseudoxanthomonas japonensis]|uniref:Hg(II)-responsive transcriptional regulator n=1 Tax=Pseudoxanthomonas japonensis TaxID=69284 RepID=UPI00374857B2